MIKGEGGGVWGEGERRGRDGREGKGTEEETKEAIKEMSKPISLLTVCPGS